MNKLRLCVIVAMLALAFGGCTTTRDFYGMELVDNPKAQNVDSPTLLAFLEQDRVSENGYELWDYICTHFAHDLHNNAEIEGIRCAIVWTSNRGHVFNAFETTDNGIVFVDASTGLDSFAYEEDGILVVDGKVPEGIHGENVTVIGCSFNLGHPEDFEIEW